MKQAAIALTVMVIILMPFTSKALQYGDFTYLTNGDSVEVTGYTGTGGVVTVPDTIDGLSVVGIDLRYVTNLASIIIPDTVTSPLYLFGCSSLTNITVDPLNPFYNSVDGVVFDKSYTVLVSYPCGLCGLQNGHYIIPYGVTNISDYAFNRSPNLADIIFPNSVRGIQNSAFEGCFSLTNVVIPSGVVFIGSQAFYDCRNLSSISFPDGLIYLGTYAFDKCPMLTSAYFQGAPPSLYGHTFFGATNVIVYYQSGEVGWGPTFDGRPTVMTWVYAVNGTVSYSGCQTGSVRVVLTSSRETNTCSLAVPGVYALGFSKTNVPFTLASFRDSNGNGTQDYWEACGNYLGNPICLTNNATGFDVTLTDPDHDADGVPDWWTWQYFGHLTGQGSDYSMGTSIVPGSSMTTFEKYLADLNPTNPASVLAVTGIQWLPQGVKIDWEGGQAVKQYVESKRDLGNTNEPWTPVFTNLPPTAIMTNVTVNVGTTNKAGFYRIRVER